LAVGAALLPSFALLLLLLLLLLPLSIAGIDSTSTAAAADPATNFLNPIATTCADATDEAQKDIVM
jgi:hypothetical protein